MMVQVFKVAKAMAPSIIYIDEVEKVSLLWPVHACRVAVASCLSHHRPPPSKPGHWLPLGADAIDACISHQCWRLGHTCCSMPVSE